MTTVNKEAIYDEQISPLMTQIIAICKEHKLGMVMSVHCPNEEDADLCCTTALLGPEFNEPPQFKNALNVLRPDLVGRSVPGFRITTTHADGTKSVEDHRFV